MELHELKFDFLPYHSAGSKISVLHYAAGPGNEISLLHFAASQISPLYDATGSNVTDFCNNPLIASCSGESNLSAA
jgi:hypothetical protein